MILPNYDDVFFSHLAFTGIALVVQWEGVTFSNFT
jgi:hypothetical protein